jgi:hypothetical protein
MTNMKGRILLRVLSLVSLFLVLALAMVASAQTRRVGVNAGNKFRYSATASWSSNDPSDRPGPYVTRYNDTQWLEVNIAAIDGTNVIGQITNHYKNGTEESSGGSIDIDTGNGSNMTYLIISAGLSAGDSLYTSSDFSGFINETVSRTYSSRVRNTNHINITSLSEVSYTASNMYWDRLTGVLVDLSVEDTYQTANYTTSWSTGLRIISSDLWVVPEFSTWTPALLMLIALTSATIVIVRQRGRIGTPCSRAFERARC